MGFKLIDSENVLSPFNSKMIVPALKCTKMGLSFINPILNRTTDEKQAITR